MRVQELLERRTAPSAVLLRKLLGKIRLEPVVPEVGKPYYRAVTNLDVLALVEGEPSSDGSEPGANTLHWWRRRDLHPGPKIHPHRNLRCVSASAVSRPA